MASKRAFKIGQRVKTVEPQGGFHAGVITSFDWVKHFDDTRTLVAVVKYDEWVNPFRVPVKWLYAE